MSATDVVQLIRRLQDRGYKVYADWNFSGGVFRWNVVASRIRDRG